MVRFGKTLEEQRVPEWASGYVDYKGLKKTLASMIASGSIQKFNENTVYSPISVATTEVVSSVPVSLSRNWPCFDGSSPDCSDRAIFGRPCLD